jgi:hypothetical protein
MHSKNISTYELADKWFNERKAVRSTAWGSHERPTAPKGTDPRGRLIRRHDGEYYDVKLYNTVMGRLFKPEVINGQRIERRCYMGHYSPLSREFMGKALNLSRYNSMFVEGKRRIVPVYDKSMPGSDFSAEFVYVDGALDIAQSRHTPHYKHVSTDEDKKRRAAVAKQFENYILLAQMRIPEFEASATLTTSLGTPFRGAANARAYAEAMEDILTGSPDAVSVNLFFAMCQEAFDTIASKRGYAQGDFQLRSRWGGKQAQSPLENLDKPVTPEDLRRSVLLRVNSALNIGGQSGTVEIPQFVVESEYPKSNISLYK